MPMDKVLLVDADPQSRAALCNALAEAGYEVAVSSSGSAAVGALEWERPDLVVSYAQVQDMDGYEFFTMVRKDPTTMDTPFLLLAGRDRPVALAAAEAGVDMTVTGDFTLELVVGQVRELLENGRRADAPRLVGPAERTGQPRSEPLLAALERVAFRTAVEPAGAALQGSLEVMDLAEVAQAIALGGKTGSLVVSLAAGQGVIAFDAGRIVHADFLGRRGEPAFAAIVAASQRETDARFHFSRQDRALVARGPRTINHSVEQLLLSIAVGIDEGETAGSEPLDSARPAGRAEG